jgi:hypothetical protein
VIVLRAGVVVGAFQAFAAAFLPAEDDAFVWALPRVLPGQVLSDGFLDGSFDAVWHLAYLQAQGLPEDSFLDDADAVFSGAFGFAGLGVRVACRLAPLTWCSFGPASGDGLAGLWDRLWERTCGLAAEFARGGRYPADCVAAFGAWGCLCCFPRVALRFTRGNTISSPPSGLGNSFLGFPPVPLAATRSTVSYGTGG